MIALTTIRHGNEDGTVLEILEGEVVKGLPEDVVDSLAEQGLVGEAPKAVEEALSENEELKARVAELAAQLEAATAKTTQPPTPVTK